jgi:DNA polymerase-3 subunit delta'
MNWDFLGHEWAIQLLKGYVVQGTSRHAYLFTGPQGIGRRTLALRFAQALNCTQPPAPGEFCGRCRSCRLINRMEHPDLSIVQAEQIGGTLKVDQVRELQRTLSLTPYEARYRVALLLRFEEANSSAANALLKTLEEPPPQVILLVTAETSERLLPTIVSRCEVLRLRPMPVKTVAEGLERQRALPPDRASLLAHLSGGRPGQALQLHQEPALLNQRQTWLDDQNQLLAASRVARFAYAETLAKDKETLRGELQVWLSFWRDVLLLASGAKSPITNFDRAEDIEKLAAHFGLLEAYRMVAAIERTMDLLERNVNVRLATEVLLLSLPRF